MNNIKNNKLELIWIGKDKLPRLEPRIFLESKEYSYFNVSEDIGQDGGQDFSNLLIKSDNLLALKALEQDFTGKVKCIVIDPPYNTGSAFSHYDDGLEHSMWLTLMRDRLVLLYQLLSDDGSLWITIDDNESHYLKVMCDEIFGRGNFVTDITWQRKYSVSNNFKGIASICDRILVYRKSDKFVNNLLPRTEDSVARYKNPDNDPRGPWKSVDYLNQATPEKRPNLCYDIINPNTGEVIKNTKKAWKYDRETHRKHVEEKRIWWGVNGTNTTPAVKLFLSEVRDGMTPHNWWPHEDVGHTDEAKKEIIQLFGRQDVFDTPKPERLIQRILTIATNPGDLVLDSFAGSGTTGAVAQKMGRRWIMVELGDHCETHIVPRIKKVIDGEDQGGISKAVNWQGGGGFRYLRLAPSLLQKDEWGNWVINKEYNAEMLSAAMCKHMGFTYAPSETQFWNHGYSTETDFIYVTTGSLAYDQLKRISEDVGEDRTLLICCKAFMSEGAEFPNLTIKKIPQLILNKCEWDNDDYSFTLNVLAEPEEYELDDEDDQ
ncbi:site-specific DNA-methyltransferase [Marinomonas sp. 15G1-11]|uniref:site-specific DNA-methyltransferase (adenine-specific) n=1 Tax=Marinomonas phaeophyticola TaxID=3004091 RepID=A0ABT4JRT4_9GAMM|nr:site-specific DNA-methyltransferase [Marinomonas sp. 15G1-11]MCZ2721074.1 site-specific DNA-methyltransferase [Marinomonas sp. 15G1-11]